MWEKEKNAEILCPLLQPVNGGGGDDMEGRGNPRRTAAATL